MNVTKTYMEHTLDFFYHLNYGYITWVLWVIYPIIISFILPTLIAISFYASALFLLIYRRRNYIREAYAADMWEGARQMLSVFWEVHGRIWYGFEVVGLDKLPDTGPALVIYYHGVIPIDFYYVLARCMLQKGRAMRMVGDRFLFNIPGWRLLLEVCHVTPGTVQSCVDVLKNGHILAISPGGVREALFGDEYYRLMWTNRVGFAKVALQANVPVIPLFTQNVREAFRTPSLCRNWLRTIYERTRLPLIPIYGGFPVKLRSIFGDPVHPDPETTPEEYAHKIEITLQELINKHQRVPGSIFRALLDRVSRRGAVS